MVGGSLRRAQKRGWELGWGPSEAGWDPPWKQLPTEKGCEQNVREKWKRVGTNTSLQKDGKSKVSFQRMEKIVKDHSFLKDKNETDFSKGIKKSWCARKKSQESAILGGASGKELTCQCRRRKRRGFHPWVGKIPWRRKWQPTPVFLPGESHEWRSLMVYSSWGRKELDTTEMT